MNRVVAHARLHFGLLRSSPDPATGHYGGCGLILKHPQVIVRAEQSEAWSATGPDAERAIGFAQRVTTQCHKLVVEQIPPAHCGLGTGTALALAVGKAVAPELNTAELARRTGRGGRSRVGLTGFDTGGFVYEFTDSTYADSLPWPSEWRIVVLVPEVEPTWHGLIETEAFQRMQGTPVHRDIHAELQRCMDELVRNMMRSAFSPFTDALYKYNRLSGSLFQSVQGGIYAHPIISLVVDELRVMGIAGVGQSSWGPGVFAVCQSEAEAQRVFAEIESFTPWRYRTITSGS